MTDFRLRMMIEQLFDAVLTAEEERELCRDLRENDVPAELRRDKEVILTFFPVAAVYCMLGQCRENIL